MDAAGGTEMRPLFHMELLLCSSRDPALLSVWDSKRLAWGTDLEGRKSSFPAGFQHLLTPGGTKILGEELWLHQAAAWSHLFTSLQPQTPPNTSQLCYRCLTEQGGPAGSAGRDFPAWGCSGVSQLVWDSSGRGWAVLVSLLSLSHPHRLQQWQECCCLQPQAAQGSL